MLQSKVIKRQIERNDPFVWEEKQLHIERKLYRKYAESHDFLFLLNLKFEDTFEKIIDYLTNKIGQE